MNIGNIQIGLFLYFAITNQQKSRNIFNRLIFTGWHMKVNKPLTKYSNLV